MRKNAKKGLDRVNASLPELLGLSRAGKRETLLPSAWRDAAIVGYVASARLSQETREERRRLSGRGGGQASTQLDSVPARGARGSRAHGDRGWALRPPRAEVSLSPRRTPAP